MMDAILVLISLAFASTGFALAFGIMNVMYEVPAKIDRVDHYLATGD